LKRASIYISIFLFLIFISNFTLDYSAARQIEGRSPYYLCFASIGAISLESRMDCWAKLEADLDDNQMRDELKKIIKILEIPPANGQIVFDRQGQIRKLQYNGASKGVDYGITITSNAAARISDFTCTAKTRNKYSNLQKAAQALEAASSLTWKCYYLYSGRLPTPLNEAAQRELMKVVLKHFKGQEINRYHDSRMTVITAYSPVVGVESVVLAGRKCNLQASIRRDSISDNSYVYIGSPLILGDY